MYPPPSLPALYPATAARQGRTVAASRVGPKTKSTCTNKTMNIPYGITTLNYN